MPASSPPGQATAAAPEISGIVELAPGARAKIRSPIWVAVFALITLGIYVVFWWYYVNRELADYGRARNSPELGDNMTARVFRSRMPCVTMKWIS